MATDEQIEKAKSIVGWYAVAASATGAIPVPLASVGVVAETASMFTHLSSVLGVEISWANMLESFGVAMSLNVLGRTIFVEGAKALSWGTGNGWAAIALSGLGATTAGVQTYILGLLAIEIGKNDGRAILPATATRLVEDAKASYEGFVADAKRRGLQKPA